MQSKYGYLCRLISGTEPPEWDEAQGGDGYAFVEMANMAGVTSLLYTRFLSDPSRLPDEIWKEIVHSHYKTLARNTLLLGELKKLLHLFGDAKIPVVVLKGGALADRYYEDFAQRPMQDLDLLIPEHQVDHAILLVQAMGYVPSEVEITAGINRQTVHNTSWHGGPDGRVGLELHWNLIVGQADDRSVPLAWFWKQVENVPGRSSLLRGQMIPQLSPTAHLLYLSAHLVIRHGGDHERLIWFYDADRLVRSEGVDWKLFVAQAHQLGWGSIARYMLDGTKQRFATPLLAGLLDTLSSGAEWLGFLNERNRATRLSRFDKNWTSLKHFSWPIRLRMVFALFFPSFAYIRWRYHPQPEWVWPLYYFYRWGEVFRELFRIVFPVAKVDV